VAAPQRPPRPEDDRAGQDIRELVPGLR
jgi:hypothetical protein